MAKNIVIPSNTAELKVIKSAIGEASDCLIRIDSEKEAIKDIVEDLAEKYELPKRFISKMIKTHHKATFDKETSDLEDFMELYTAVQGAK